MSYPGFYRLARSHGYGRAMAALCAIRRDDPGPWEPGPLIWWTWMLDELRADHQRRNYRR